MGVNLAITEPLAYPITPSEDTRFPSLCRTGLLMIRRQNSPISASHAGVEPGEVAGRRGRRRWRRAFLVIDSHTQCDCNPDTVPTSTGTLPLGPDNRTTQPVTIGSYDGVATISIGSGVLVLCDDGNARQDEHCSGFREESPESPWVNRSTWDMHTLSLPNARRLIRWL